MPRTWLLGVVALTWVTGCRTAPRAPRAGDPGRSTPAEARAGTPAPGPADSSGARRSSAAPDSLGARDSAGSRDTTAPRRPRLRIDPSTALRFEIVEVGDSTFTFLAPAAPWARAGTQGLAVDPRRRDVLVAAFDVLALRGDTAVALVTGQTARVTTDHIALLERPPAPPPPKRRSYAEGMGAGAAIGLVLGIVAGLLAR